MSDQRNASGLRRCLGAALLIAFGGFTAACGGGDDGTSTPPPVVAGPLARLEVSPAAVTLTSTDQGVTLQVRGFDVNGVEVMDLRPTFASSDPEQITVSEAGRVAGPAALGSALVVARVGTIAAAPVTVLALKLAAGVVPIADAQIVSPPALLNAGTGLSPQFRAQVDASLDISTGSLVVGTGQIALAGRVLAVRSAGSSKEIDVEVTPIETLVSDMSLNLQFQPDQLQLIQDSTVVAVGQRTSALSSRSGAVRPLANHSFMLGSFACNADVDPSIMTGEFEASMSPDVGFSLRRVVVDGRNVSGEAIAQGSLQASAKAILRIGAAVTGSLACSMPFGRLNVPVFGLASFIVAPSIPLRLDSEFALAVSTAAFTFGAQGTATVDVKLGLAWDESGGATPFNTFEVTSNFTRTAEFPEDAGVRVKGTLFLGPGSGLDLSVGNIGILSLARLELVKVQAGPEFEAKFGSLYDAAADPVYTTEYELKLKLAASPGDSVAEIVRELTASARSLDLSAKIEKSLAKSPQPAGIAVDVAEFGAGDTLTFTVKLDGDKVSFPGVGYNVKEVRIYRLRNSGQTGADLIATAPASDGQTLFVMPWAAADAGKVYDALLDKPNFYAFVVDKAFSAASTAWPLELGPVLAPASYPLFKIAGIGTAGFAIGPDGLLHSFGQNNGGALGAGLPIGQTVGFGFNLANVLVSGLTDVRSITGDAWFGVALLGNGSVWAWGWGESINSSLVNNPVPIPIFAGEKFVSISSGYGYTALIKDNGEVYRFGSKTVARLDNGLTGIVAVAQGQAHTLLLTSDGTVWGVGSNKYAQLGSADTTMDTTVPVVVSGLSDVVSIAAGAFHSLALRRDGTVWAWGSNAVGQLGIGASPEQMPTTPVPTSTPLSNIARISTGEYHSLALDRNGSAYGWGSNANCQLGLGRGTASVFSAPQFVHSGVVDIDGGEFHSLFTFADGAFVGYAGDVAGLDRSCNTFGFTGMTAATP